MKIPLSSSTIDTVEYNRFTKELFVKFHNGGIYTYKAVPIEIFVDFLNAKSAGSFHAMSIKHNYEFSREE